MSTYLLDRVGTAEETVGHVNGYIMLMGGKSNSASKSSLVPKSCNHFYQKGRLGNINTGGLDQDRGNTTCYLPTGTSNVPKYTCAFFFWKVRPQPRLCWKRLKVYDMP